MKSTRLTHYQKMNDWYAHAEQVMAKMLAALPENKDKTKIQAEPNDYDDFFIILREHISFVMDSNIKKAWKTCMDELVASDDAVMLPYFCITAKGVRTILGFDQTQADRQQAQLSETHQQIAQNLQQNLANDFYEKHPEVKQKINERENLMGLLGAERQKFNFLANDHPIQKEFSRIRIEIASDKTSKSWSHTTFTEFHQKIINASIDGIGEAIKKASNDYLDKYDHSQKKKKGFLGSLSSLFNPHRHQPIARKLSELADSLSNKNDLIKKLDILIEIADIIGPLQSGKLRGSLDNVHDYIIDIVVAVQYPNADEKKKQLITDALRDTVLVTEIGFSGTTLSDLVRDAKTELLSKPQAARKQ